MFVQIVFEMTVLYP